METLKLGRHKLRVPAICAAVIGGNVDVMAAGIARAIKQRADIVEIRLDGLHKQVGWEKLLKRDMPLILTNRAEREGGRFKGEERARLNQLLKGIAEGVTCVDIELSTSRRLLNEVVKTAKNPRDELAHKSSRFRSNTTDCHHDKHRRTDGRCRLRYR